MNENQWEAYTNYLTGELGVTGTAVPEHNNHLQIALDFYNSLDIDDENKSFLGVGARTNEIQKHIKAKWKGIDINPAHEDVIKSDIHNLPYENGQFDVVFSSHTLEHVLSPIICLYEIKRVTKPDGDIILSLPIYPGVMCDSHGTNFAGIALNSATSGQTVSVALDGVYIVTPANYMMIPESWEHLFNRLDLKIIKKEINGHCVSYHLKK